MAHPPSRAWRRCTPSAGPPRARWRPAPAETGPPEIPRWLSELLPLLRVLERRGEGAARHADHLGADPDAPGVQRLDHHFVPHAHLTHHVRCRDLAALEDQLARARGADAELVLFLADAESPEASLHREGGDPLVALGEVAVREHDEQPGLRAVHRVREIGRAHV